MCKFFLHLAFVFLAAQIPSQAQKLVVLGIAQDAGYPQIGSEQEYRQIEKGKAERQKAASLGLIDEAAGQKFIFEATPDMPEQLFILNKYLPSKNTLPDGVFLTHAHIGHYTGLMYFGREAIGASGIKVYAMPRMREFLSNNGPWSQLISLKNISLLPLGENVEISLNPSLRVRPFLVPHRDEFSETAGFEISGTKKRAIFIPDIDKWAKWRQDLKELVRKNDYLLLDATFYRNGEIPRDMSEVPHPFVEETIKLLSDLPRAEKNKVTFIHFNHTNPLLDPKSKETKEVLKAGFRIAREGMEFKL